MAGAGTETWTGTAKKKKGYPMNKILDQWAVETAYGEVFSGVDLADLAWAVYRRFGRDHPVALEAWGRLFLGPSDPYDFALLVETGRERWEKCERERRD